jgi:hypothetical protein
MPTAYLSVRASIASFAGRRSWRTRLLAFLAHRRSCTGDCFGKAVVIQILMPEAGSGQRLSGRDQAEPAHGPQQVCALQLSIWRLIHMLERNQHEPGVGPGPGLSVDERTPFKGSRFRWPSGLQLAAYWVKSVSGRYAVQGKG